ncbi:MAG: MBL fold metallo-hydrolase [Solirubrobacteraceae bacterium]
MRVTVLGKSPSWQDAGGACSGYLVHQGDFTLLLDCGSGVFSKLRATCDYAEVDAVLVSHMHSDHFIDLVPFSNALCFGPRRLPRPAAHLPPGGAQVLRRAAAFGGMAGLADDAFQISEYDPAGALALGPLQVAFRPVPHYIPANAVSLSAGGVRFVFSADCGPSEELVRFAGGCDLLLIEATVEHGDDRGDPPGHMTPREAGEHGRRAGARRLVVTHFSDELDLDGHRTEAEAGFGRPVELAHEGGVYEL